MTKQIDQKNPNMIKIERIILHYNFSYYITTFDLNGILNQEKNPEKSICQLKYIFIASSEFKTDLRFKNLEGAQVSIK